MILGVASIVNDFWRQSCNGVCKGTVSVSDRGRATRVSKKRVKSESHKSVKEERPTKVSRKRVKSQCLTKVSCKSVP